MRKEKHCKVEYTVLVNYTDDTLIEVIEVKGKQYKVVRLPRPTKTINELFCVYVDGIRYTTFAKFLKSL